MEFRATCGHANITVILNIISIDPWNITVEAGKVIAAAVSQLAIMSLLFKEELLLLAACRATAARRKETAAPPQGLHTARLSGSRWRCSRLAPPTYSCTVGHLT